MQTLSALAIERNVLVSKDRQNEIVHTRFLEPASFPRGAAECRRALNFVREEIADVCNTNQ